MTGRRPINVCQARRVGARLRLDRAQISLDQFRRGLEMELRHNSRHIRASAAKDDLVLTGRIALGHLRQLPEYYNRLDGLEAEAANEAEASAYAYWGE